MHGRLKARHFLGIFCLSTFFVYQNCTQAPDTTNTAASYQSSLPFAYKATIDTIAYMSCSEITDTSYEPRAYFTFRAGAYASGTGGLTLTQPFRDSTKYYAVADRGIALSESNYNMNAVLNLSIRSTSNYQSLWQTDAANIGFEMDGFLPPLDTDEIAGPLAGIPAGVSLNYFPGTADQRLMEASLRFLKAENVSSLTRNNLDQRTSLLVAAYSNSPDLMDTTLRSPLNVLMPDGSSPAPAPTPAIPHPSTANTVFGTGYQLNFSLPAGYASGDRRVISSAGIQEIDLLSGGVLSSNWSCSIYDQFMIVRPEDKANNLVLCNATVDRYNNTTEQAELTHIRRVLRVEDWFVDLTNHCVMPKRTGDYCYGATLGTRTIQYGVNSCVDSATTVCPHFVNVCIRQ